jgi:hypothetical protein
VAEHNIDQLRHFLGLFGSRLRTAFSARVVVETLCRRADVVIGPLLVPAAPKLITAGTAKATKPGAVIVDVSIDQGGFRTTMRDLHRGDVPVHHHQVGFDLYGGRRRALRVTQHAGRGGAYAEQCQGAVRAHDRRQGLCSRSDGRPLLA